MQGFTLADRRRPARRRRNEYYCRIDMSPLAGIFVALWLVLSPIGVMDFHFHSASVDLPERLHAGFLIDARREDALFVSVQRDGTHWLGNNQDSLGDLATVLREGVWNGAERKVYLKVDLRAKYGAVKLALVEVWRSGIKEVGILTN
jgi:biopolymer transport protein ExbD